MSNFGVLSAWVGIVAFVLAIPLAVAANILTPKIQNWWARTSQSRRLARMEKLKSDIRDYEYLVQAKDGRDEYLSLGLLEFTKACSRAPILLWMFACALLARAVPFPDLSYISLHWPTPWATVLFLTLLLSVGSVLFFVLRQLYGIERQLANSLEFFRRSSILQAKQLLLAATNELEQLVHSSGSREAGTA